MAETLILIRASTHTLDEKAVQTYFRFGTETLEGLPGYRGAGLWRDTQDPTHTIVMFDYESEEAAHSALRFMVERPLIQQQYVGSEPADVLSLTILHSEGALRGHFELAEFLSLSTRVADPGRGKDLARELDQIFSQLRYIEGYSGSLVGANQGLDEEVIGLVAWESLEAFQASIPRDTPYEVRIFQKAW